VKTARFRRSRPCARYANGDIETIAPRCTVRNRGTLAGIAERSLAASRCWGASCVGSRANRRPRVRSGGIERGRARRDTASTRSSSSATGPLPAKGACASSTGTLAEADGAIAPFHSDDECDRLCACRACRCHDRKYGARWRRPCSHRLSQHEQRLCVEPYDRSRKEHRRLISGRDFDRRHSLARCLDRRTLRSRSPIRRFDGHIPVEHGRIFPAPSLRSAATE
jgi:hypothetical protein